MTKIRFFTTLSLLAVLLAACAPSASPTAAEATQAVLTEPATEPPAATQEVVATPLAVATSRGPELHATDPSTVSLASGQIQLVEFFRFT